MKKGISIVILLLLIIVSFSFYFKKENTLAIKIYNKLLNTESKTSSARYFKLDSFITVSKQYCKKQNYDTTLALFLNYKKHSGTKRGYIIDLIKKEIKDSFIVSHGCGNNNWGSDESRDSPVFSNELESHCSSLGKYKLSVRAYSQWGINVKYMLYGLDKTNSNAYKRAIVLHGWNDVNENETFPNGAPEGWGCPAVSNNTMQILDTILSGIKKPVLLWAF